MEDSEDTVLDIYEDISSTEHIKASDSVRQRRVDTRGIGGSGGARVGMCFCGRRGRGGRGVRVLLGRGRGGAGRGGGAGSGQRREEVGLCPGREDVAGRGVDLCSSSGLDMSDVAVC